jgi:23S rRNA pseudouridine1911/1915/1917 synthase
LHAGILGFIHPSSGERLRFEGLLPPYFTEMLAKLR